MTRKRSSRQRLEEEDLSQIQSSQINNDSDNSSNELSDGDDVLKFNERVKSVGIYFAKIQYVINLHSLIQNYRARPKLQKLIKVTLMGMVEPFKK